MRGGREGMGVDRVGNPKRKKKRDSKGEDTHRTDKTRDINITNPLSHPFIDNL